MGVPANLLYTKEHEWLKQEGNVVVVGITEHAQSALGDVVYVELPDVGSSVKKDATFGTVESVKAVSDLFAPVSGKVVAINEALTSSPETVNQDPYGAAWMIKIELSNPSEINDLMAPGDYDALIAG